MSPAQGFDGAGQGPRELQWMPGAAAGPCWRAGAGPFAAAAPSRLGAARASSCAASRRPPFPATPAATRQNAGTGREAQAVRPTRHFKLDRIERLELFPEQPLRPSVRDEVMKLDHQRMIVFVKPKQLGPQRRLLFNVRKAGAALPVPAARIAAGLLPFGARPHVETFEPRPGCSHHLQRFARHHRGKSISGPRGARRSSRCSPPKRRHRAARTGGPLRARGNCTRSDRACSGHGCRCCWNDRRTPRASAGVWRKLGDSGSGIPFRCLDASRKGSDRRRIEDIR